MKEQHQQEEEIWILKVEEQMLMAEFEAENARKQTQFISESAARRTELEKKRREVEQKNTMLHKQG